MTDEDRKDAERLARECIEGEFRLQDLYIAGYAACAEKMRSEVHDIKTAFDEERNLRFNEAGKFLEFSEAERARSAKLVEALKYIVQREWTADSKSDMAWKWINDFVEVARKATAEYEASRD